MMPLNIVFCVRSDCDTFPGGDIVQMETWSAVLRRLGHKVTILKSPVAPSGLAAADLAFVWHLERVDESFPAWLAARRQGIPVALAPTYWPAFARPRGFALLKQFELAARSAMRGLRQPGMLFRSWARCRERMMRQSALLIVNSAAERELLVSEGADPARIGVVPNVIEAGLFPGGAPLPWEERSGVVCVGHFCPRKNQLGLIRALRGADLRITFIGGSRPMHRRYMSRCIAEAAGRHRFLGRIAHAEAVDILRRSRYAVSASFAETPGIGNLEAAAAGCGLILPDLRPVREYFGDAPAAYVDPRKIDAAAVVKAVAAPPDPRLRERVFAKFTDAELPSYWEPLLTEREGACTGN